MALVMVASPTTSAGASNHLGPTPTADASLDWVDDVPLADLDQAAVDDELTLVATAGSSAPVVSNVGFGFDDRVEVDVDGNGDLDLEAWLTVETSVDPPVAELNVTRVADGDDPTDVEVLALVPWDDRTDDASTARHNLVVGFRTAELDSAGEVTTGGTLPGHSIIGFQMDPLAGLEHQLDLQFVTEGSQDPQRLLTGYFDGTDDDGVVAADLLSTLPHEPTSNVNITLNVDASELGTAPEHGEASLDWDAADPAPVTFEYLEAEDAPGQQPDIDTRVLADEMPADATLSLRLQEDGGDSGRPAVLSWSADDTMDVLEVQHRRNNDDGPTLIDGRLEGVEPEVELAVHDEGAVKLTLPEPEHAQPDDGRVDLELEASLADLETRPDGRAWFGTDAFSHELDHLVARVDDAPEVTLTPELGQDTGFTLELPTGGVAPPDVRFLATDDLAAPELPQSWSDGSLAVSGHPETWPTPWQRSGEIGVVDRHAEGASVAARFGELKGIEVTTTADTMAERASLLTSAAQDLRLDTFLSAGAPMANGTTVEVGCDLELPAGEAAIDIEQPGHYGWALSDEMPHLRCQGERGDEEFLLEADRIPARTTVEVPDFGDTADGSLEVTAQDASGSPVDTDIGRLELQVNDLAEGLTGDDELLGQPVGFAVVRAEDLPSSDADWSTSGEQTSVDIAARTDGAPENRIGSLDVRLRSDRPNGEALLGLPAPNLGGSRYFDAHYLQAVEEGASVWLGAGVRDAEQLHAETADDAATTSMTGTFAARHPAAVDLRTTDGGPFTASWSLDLVCAVGPVSVQLDGLTLAPAEQRLALDAPDGFGDLACHQPKDPTRPAEVERAAADLDATFSAEGGDLPADLAVDLDPGSQIDLDTGAGEVGFVQLALEDRSGAGLPGTDGLFQDPVGAASVRFDDAASSTVSWTTEDATRIAAVPERVGGKVGTIQADLRTDDSAGDPAEVSGGDPHRFAVSESVGGSSYDASLAARLVQVGASTFELGDGLDAQLSTVADRMLDAEVETDSGGAILPTQDVDATLELEDVPGSLSYTTDLAGYHEVDSSEEVDALRFAGTVDDVEANGVVNGLPDEVTVDTQGSSVTASGGVDEVDAKITDTSSDAGLFDGVNVLRVTAEDLPGDLAVDLDGLRADTTLETGPDGEVQVLDGTASLAPGEGSSGPLGRLAVTVGSSRGGGFFETPYRYAHMDLEGVPASWTVSYGYDAATGDAEVDIAPDQGSLSSALFQVTRKKGAAEAVSEELVNFEDEAVGLERSAFTEAIDRRHFPGSVEQRLDDLFDDPASLATTTRAERGDPWPEEGSGPGADLTVPDQDHVILLEGGSDGPKTLSARISDISSTTLELNDPSSDARIHADLERSGGEPGHFFFGVRDRTWSLHAEPDDPLSAPDPEDGHPQASDSVAYYSIDASGPVRFRPLVNDDPASDADADQLDTSTLRIVEGPQHGTANVDGPRIAYEPETDHVGYDELRYEICDEGGDCSQAILTVITAEPYHDVTVASLADLPNQLTLEVEGTEADEDDDTAWEPRELVYRADDSLGRLDLFQGPLNALEVADPQRIRGVAYDGPSEVAARLNGTGLLGIETFDVDTSSETDLVLAIQQEDQRSIVGFEGEDLTIDTPIEGALNGDTFAFEAKSGHPHTLPNVDGTDGCKLSHTLTPCAQLAFAGLDVRARGDDTGTRSSGFVSLYRRREDLQGLDPSGPAPGDSEWVPALTGRYRDVQGVSAGSELRLLPFNPLLLNFKAGANINASSVPAVDIDLWWNADEACFPVHPQAGDTLSRALGPDDSFSLPAGVGSHIPNYELTYDSEIERLCATFRTPDYVDSSPIEFGPVGPSVPFGFDPYEGELPDPVDRLGSGIATLDVPYVSPGLRFLVIPVGAGFSTLSADATGGLVTLASNGETVETVETVETGEIEVTEQPPAEIDPPPPGDPLAAVHLDGDAATFSAGVEVIFDLGHYAPEGQPVCAANRLADGGIGAETCMSLSHDEAVEQETGSVLRLVVERPGTVVLVEPPSAPRPSVPRSACEESFVPPAGEFDDVAGNVHQSAIECAAWYGLTRGMGDTDGDGEPEFGPNQTLRRGQMASFLTRLAVQAGVELPEDPPDAFGDDEGSVHEGAIDALAALGVTQGRGDVDGDGRADFAPGQPVRRAQMASFLTRELDLLVDAGAIQPDARGP